MSTGHGRPNPDGFTMDERPTGKEAADSIIEALTEIAGPSQPPTDRGLRDFIVFVSPVGETKRICRHTFMADDRDAAARHVAEHCSLAINDDIEVEVFVHAGVMYRYELVEQKGKK